MAATSVSRKGLFIGTLALTLAVVALAASGGSRARAQWKQDWANYQQIIRIINQDRNFPEAEKQIRALLTRQPEAYILYWRLGYVVASQGRHAEALQAYEQARQLNPFLIRDGVYLMLVGDAYLQSGDRDKARRYFLASLEQPQLTPEYQKAVEQALAIIKEGGAK